MAKFMLVTAAILLIATTLSAEESSLAASSGPGRYEITDGSTRPIVIPFTVHKGKPLLTLEINGQPATLMIDNGVLWDPVWLFGSPLVDVLDLKPVDDYSIGGAGEGDPTQAYSSSDLTLSFEGIVFYEQPVLVSPPAAGFADMFPGVDGQLCNTFFKHFVVEFDFIENNMILHPPDQFDYDGEGSILPLIENESGTHAVPFSFTLLNGQRYSDRVDVDFGGIYPLKIALNNAFNIQLSETVESTHSYGAQGKSTEFRGEIKSMTIGNYTFDSPIAYFGDGKTSRIHPDSLGVIGLPLFMKFDIVFDYINNRLYLDANARFDEPFE